MESQGSITECLDVLRRQTEKGVDRAVEEIWKRWSGRLMHLAHQKLRDVPRRAEDEEDVVQSGFMNLVLALRDGRYPELQDRKALWFLLARIIENRAINCRKRQLTRKRGEGKVRGDSVLGGPPGGDDGGMRMQIAAPDPTPEIIAEELEQLRFLLDVLSDDSLRSVALMRLDGYANAEIADKLGVCERTVERKLNLIRSEWSEEFGR
jgi:RNA polymerase sigma factor (sigma-70 family)